MPIQEPKGLPGLRGWGEISQQERDAFKAAHPKVGGMTWKQQKSAYANQQFIDRFGKDQFNRMSRQERDAMYRSAVVGDAIDETFKDDERYDQIKDLSTEGQLELLNSDYKKHTDRLQELNTWDEKHGDTFRAATLVAGQAGLNLMKGKARNKSTSIFNDIQNRDSERKAEDTIATKDAVAGNIIGKINSGELSVDEFNQQFDALFKGGKTTVSSSLGNITVDNPGIAHYKAFENAHELENYGLEDKIQDYSEYLAIQNKYGTQSAIQALENKFQRRVTANQNAWDWIGSAAYGAGTKAAANIANKVVGLSALTMAGNKDRLANYLEGKDAYGEDLAWWRSPKYWNGVDQYSSLDPNYIAKVQNDYGGVSKYNLQTNPGEERSFSVAMNEAFKMAGYMASDVLVGAGLGKIANALTTAAGGEFIAGELASNAPKLAQLINKSAPFAIGAVNATGISESYGIQAYEQTLQEANQRVNNKISKDANAYVQSILGGESGLSFNNGKLTGNNDVSKSTAALLNNYVDIRVNQLLEANPDLDARKIDREALYDEGITQYAEVLGQQYMTEHEADYAQDRKMARDAAATAYMIDASFEEARMAFANVTYRKFLLGDAQRKALNNQFRNLNTVDINGKLFSTGANGTSAGFTKWSPLLKNIWGGARDNYLDDVTVAFSKGFALSQYNNAVDSELSPQQYAATTNFVSNFLVGMTGGIESARISMTDPQSLFDGFVGGVGGAITIAPRLGRIIKGESGGRYDTNDVYRAAFENGSFADEYGLIDVDKYMKSEAFQDDVKSGKVRQRSIAERINDYVFNPLLQEYSEASQRLRDYNYLIDVANRTIAENRPKFDELVRFASVLNGTAEAQENGSLLEAKEAKAKQAYLLAATLKQYSEDPIFSQSNYIQQVQQQLEDFAKGNIDDATIAQFLAQPSNKSINEGANPAEVAKQRIQTNAQQLVEMQKRYVSAVESLNDSEQAMVIANSDSRDYVINQLAFNQAMKGNRDERMSQMENEVRGTREISETSTPIALYGSEEGRVRFEEVQQEYVDGHQKRIGAIEKQIEALKKVKDRTGRKNIAIQAKQLELAEERRRLSEAKEELSRIKKSKDFDYSRVLSKDEILALNPVERARMLQTDDNPAQYSSEQQKVIQSLIEDLNMRDPSLLQKIQDSKTLYERNKDLVRSNQIMLNNMKAAADYYGYAKAMRDFGVLKVYNKRAQDYNDALLNQFDTSNQEAIDANIDSLIEQAKQFSSDMLDGYLKRYPEKEDILRPIVELAKLKSDTDSAIRTRFGADEESVRKYASLIDNIYNAEHITNVEQAMSAFEDLVDAAEGQEQQTLNQVLDDLQALHYQRNATKIQEREYRKEHEAEIAAEKARREDGANYGWAGFKVGDTVYRNDKKRNNVGVVTGFNERTGSMQVRWGNNKRVQSVTDKDSVSKEQARTLFENPNPPQVQKENPVPQPQEEPAKPAPVVDPLPVSDKTIDKDGSVVELTPEQKTKRALSSSEVVVVKSSVEDPMKIANEQIFDGVMIGNALYEYESAPLTSTVKGHRNAVRKQAYGSLKAFYDWEDATGTDVQAIIDNELADIVSENPDIPVRFMQKKVADGDAMGDVILEVVEYTPAVAKHHNEKYSSKAENHAVFDSSGKKWLVIGTFGFNKKSSEMVSTFNRIKALLKDERREFFNANEKENYYVSPYYSTKIDVIYSGLIVDSYNGEGMGSTRTLGELMNGESKAKTNPHKINYDNAVFGIMYTREGLVLINRNNIAEGKKVFPPQDVDTNVGLTFIMVPASDGNYIPIALDPAKLNQLEEGSDLMSIIDGYINRLAAPELSERQETLKRLSDYLVFVKDRDEIRVEGNDITILRTGEDNVTIKKTISLDDPAVRANLRDEIVNVAQFRVNITPKVLETSSMLELYDQAGAIRTTAAKLGTVNASFNVLMIDKDGKPIEKSVPASEPQGVTVPKVTLNKVTYNGIDYSVSTDGKVYDLNGNPVNYRISRQVKISNYITTQNLTPEHTTNDGKGKYYRIAKTTGTDLIVLVSEDGIVKELTDAQATQYNERLAKKRADAAARKAIEEGQPLPDEVPGAMTLNLPKSQDLGTDIEGYEEKKSSVEEEKQPAKPTPEVAPTKKVDNRFATKSVAGEDNGGKSYNFTIELRDTKSRTYIETNSFLELKGYDVESMSLKQKKEALKKEGISFDTATNEESFIDMLNRCKK